MDIKIYGAIGYTILYNSDIFKDIEILLISDMHEEFIKKCDSIEEITIDKYIKNLLDKDYTIILEEIPNNRELEELFPTSNHVKEIRKLFLNNMDKITGIDIRLDIINITNIKSNNEILIKKLLNIYKFYLFKNDLFKHLTLYNKKINKSIIKDYYLKVIKKFKNFLYYCDDDLYKYPKNICISIWGDNINENQLIIGTQLSIDFDIESREFNGKWYTDVKAWKIELVDNIIVNESIESDIAPEEDIEDNGLPF